MRSTATTPPRPGSECVGGFKKAPNDRFFGARNVAIARNTLHREKTFGVPASLNKTIAPNHKEEDAYSSNTI
jgi:hypothetical protein